jgi:hypothetical protein
MITVKEIKKKIENYRKGKKKRTREDFSRGRAGYKHRQFRASDRTYHRKIP